MSNEQELWIVWWNVKMKFCEDYHHHAIKENMIEKELITKLSMSM